MPFFSIIITTYNRADKVIELVRSIYAQSFGDYELIIVDDGSTDDTKEKISPFINNKTHYFYIPNSERSYARNFGLRQSCGEYINYFDSDDRFYADRLDVVFSFIRSNDYPNVLFTHYNIVDERGKVLTTTQRHYHSFERDLLFNNFLATGAVFLKREVAIANTFHDDNRIITAEDWELWLRILAKHPYVECKTKTFAIVQHENRSLEKISPKRIEVRDSYFASLVASNLAYTKVFTKDGVNLFIADRYTFIALSYAIDGQRGLALGYLAKSLKRSIRVLMRRRFWGVLKNCL
jgi:glycosyltransferase involved in cell wall biosynthesis